MERCLESPRPGYSNSAQFQPQSHRLVGSFLGGTYWDPNNRIVSGLPTLRKLSNEKHVAQGQYICEKRSSYGFSKVLQEGLGYFVGLVDTDTILSDLLFLSQTAFERCTRSSDASYRQEFWFMRETSRQSESHIDSIVRQEGEGPSQNVLPMW